MNALTSLSRSIREPLAALVVMWALEITDSILPGHPLDRFGIQPRTLAGLPGIVFAPFLHGGFAHLAANTIPFLILGILVAARRAGDFEDVFLRAMLIGGAGTWLFGTPHTIHLGASGIIFGFFGFLIFRAFFERSAAAILFSILAALLYGGLIWSLLPLQQGISWSGHLFGFIGGISAARSLSRR